MYFDQDADRAKPDHQALNDLGVVLNSARQYGDARRFLERALRKKPDEPQILNNLGLALRELKEHKLAEDLLRRTLNLKPDYVFAWVNLAILLDDTGRSKEAVEAFERGLSHARELLDRRPGLYGDTHFLLSSCFVKLNRFEEAVRAAEAGLSLGGNPVYGRLFLADALLARGDLDRVNETLGHLEQEGVIPPARVGEEQSPIRSAFEAVREELWNSMSARVKNRGDERFRTEQERMRGLGVIDEEGQATSREWPVDMRPDSATDVET